MMFNNNSKNIGRIKSRYYLESSEINDVGFRPLKGVLVGVLTISAIQGITTAKVLAFEIIPLEAVFISLTSHEYLGLGNSYDTFQVEVNNNPALDPMAQLVEFTLSLNPPQGIPSAPPTPKILPNGYLFPETRLKTPLGWQLSDMGQIPTYYCRSDNSCLFISIPTLTFQVTNPSGAISPGTSLGGFAFAFAYNNRCGIYCGLGPSKLSVISISSVPEPITILGSAIALGFGISLKRKLAKPDPQSDNQI